MVGKPAFAYQEKFDPDKEPVVRDFRKHNPKEQIGPIVEFNDKVVTRADIRSLRPLRWRKGKFASPYRLTLNSCEIEESTLEELLIRTEPEALFLFNCTLPAIPSTKSNFESHVKMLLITGSSITDSNLSFLKWFSKLEDLDLKETQVNGSCLVSLPFLACLHNLNLKSTIITDQNLKEILRQCTSLERLDIRRTLCTPDSISTLPAENKITKVLVPYWNQPDGWFSTLDRFPNAAFGSKYLQEGVNLSNCALTDHALATIHSKNYATILNLSHTYITDRIYSVSNQFPKLEKLDLSNTLVTGEGICGLDRLTHLNLNNTRLTVKGITDIANLKGRISVVYLGSALPPSTDRLEAFRHNKTVRHLSLSSNPLFPEDFDNIATMESLNSLDLSNNCLSYLIVEKLRKCQRLQFLDLSHCKGLDHTSVSQIVRMKGLAKLWVENSDITNADLDWLRSELTQCSINGLKFME